MLDLDVSTLFIITNGLIIISAALMLYAVLYGVKSVKLVALNNERVKPVVIKPLQTFIPKYYCNDEDWNNLNVILHNITKNIFREIIDVKHSMLVKNNELPEHIIESIFESMKDSEADYCDIDQFNIDRLVIDFIHQKFIDLDIADHISRLVNVSTETPIRLARAGYYEKDGIPNELIIKISNEVMHEQFPNDYESSSDESTTTDNSEESTDEQIVIEPVQTEQTFNEQVINDYNITNVLPGTFITEVTQNILNDLIEDIPK